VTETVRACGYATRTSDLRIRSPRFARRKDHALQQVREHTTRLDSAGTARPPRARAREWVADAA
jgi:hypothetical protein